MRQNLMSGGTGVSPVAAKKQHNIAMTSIPTTRPAEPPEPIYRLTVEQYHEMANAGILTSDDRVELLEGYLVARMTVHPPHATSVDLLRNELGAVVPPGWFVSSQRPITTESSEPEPDGAIIRGKLGDYASKHPSPADVALVIEVADDSLHRDRTVKQRLYARARIAVYWIVNLKDRQVELFTEPGGTKEQPKYESPQIIGEDNDVPVVIDGKTIGRISVASILP